MNVLGVATSAAKALDLLCFDGCRHLPSLLGARLFNISSSVLHAWLRSSSTAMPCSACGASQATKAPSTWQLQLLVVIGTRHDQCQPATEGQTSNKAAFRASMITSKVVLGPVFVRIQADIRTYGCFCNAECVFN